MNNRDLKMNRQSQWLFEAPFSSETVYSSELEFEDELEWLNEYEDAQLETDLNDWRKATFNYFDRETSPFPDVYRWPKQSIFKVPPAETIKTGSYQTALCPALDDFLELRERNKALKSNLGTRPKIPKGLRDRQAIKRWQEAIRNWETNIKAWEKEIEVLIGKMIKRLRDKSYVGSGCTKLFFKDLAKKVDLLRRQLSRPRTMTNKMLERLRDTAVGVAK